MTTAWMSACRPGERLDAAVGSRRRRARRIACATALACMAGGCAVGPDFRSPPVPAVTTYTPDALPSSTASASSPDGKAQHFSSAAALPRQWWTLFHSAALDTLVATALANNPTIQAAQAALRVAQENASAQRGYFAPTVTATASPVRQRTATGSLTSPLVSGESIFNLQTAQLTVGYTFDVFGQNRRAVESLDAQTEAQRFQLEASRLSLSSNIVVAAFGEASLRAQIKATDGMVQLQEQQLGLLRAQFKAGSIAESNVVSQEAAVAANRALLPSLRKQLAQQRDALVAMTGGFPGDATLGPFDFSLVELPSDLPLSLPSALVEQRADVKAAEAQLHAASAQIGVATADMLPQLTLTASAGSVATQLDRLFRSGNAFWSLGGSLLQPLFDGGTLLHRRRAATAAYDVAAAQYRAAVVLAFQNVADALQALQYDADTLRDAATAQDSAASSLAIARRQVELGDANNLAVLIADLAYQQASMALIQARANRYVDTAALFQSLGGGWWNGADTTTAASTP